MFYHGGRKKPSPSLTVMCFPPPAGLSTSSFGPFLFDSLGNGNGNEAGSSSGSLSVTFVFVPAGLSSTPHLLVHAPVVFTPSFLRIGPHPDSPPFQPLRIALVVTVDEVPVAALSPAVVMPNLIRDLGTGPLAQPPLILCLLGFLLLPLPLHP